MRAPALLSNFDEIDFAAGVIVVQLFGLGHRFERIKIDEISRIEVGHGETEGEQKQGSDRG
jgi:hypothetical protein